MAELNCTYGSNKTPSTVYTYDGWYAVHGSVNVNRTYEDDLVDGVDVEELEDIDTFTWTDPITSEEELIEAVEA